MLAHYWLGDDIDEEYLILKSAAEPNTHGSALLEMLYGQLLISRRLAEGITHLDRGFKLATNLFSASDYLLVMNRHRLLRQLPLSDKPVVAEPLQALLTSAKVIERMKQSEASRPAFRHDPKDTYG